VEIVVLANSPEYKIGDFAQYKITAFAGVVFKRIQNEKINHRKLISIKRKGIFDLLAYQLP
jgi:hypothetical protein